MSRPERRGKRIEVLSAAHTVPAVGFAVDGGTDAATGQPHGWWVCTGDTGPNPLLWQRLRRMKVAHLVIETAFSDEERQRARISRHLCPTALGHELAQLEGSADVHITHIKPGKSEAPMAEIGRLGSLTDTTSPAAQVTICVKCRQAACRAARHMTVSVTFARRDAHYSRSNGMARRLQRGERVPSTLRSFP